jgi:hypothetical protein
MDICTHEYPVPHTVGGRQVACHLPDDFDVSAAGGGVLEEDDAA